MALAPIQRGSLVDAVTKRLRVAVAAGDWLVGERIPIEPELAARLGVGRNTVREAVRVLVHVGMLETRQGDGTYVRAATDSSDTLRRIERSGLHERLEVRMMLEVEAVRLAARRRKQADVRAMRVALAARADAGTDLPQRMAHDERFHHALVASAHNDALAELYGYFAGAIRETIQRTEMEPALPEPGQAAHECVLEAIERRDSGQAVAAARALLAPALSAAAAESD